MKHYYGKIIPCEKPAPNTEKYIKTRETICSTEEQLFEQIPTCKELFDSYTGALHIEAQLECEAEFERGFMLGAKLALEMSKQIE